MLWFPAAAIVKVLSSTCFNRASINDYIYLMKKINAFKDKMQQPNSFLQKNCRIRVSQKARSDSLGMSTTRGANQRIMVFVAVARNNLRENKRLQNKFERGSNRNFWSWERRTSEFIKIYISSSILISYIKFNNYTIEWVLSRFLGTSYFWPLAWLWLVPLTQYLRNGQIISER